MGERSMVRRVMVVGVQRWTRRRERRGMDTWKRFVESDRHQRSMVEKLELMDSKKKEMELQLQQLVLRGVLRHLVHRSEKQCLQHWCMVVSEQKREENASKLEALGSKQAQLVEQLRRDMSLNVEMLNKEHEKKMVETTSSHRRTLAMRTIKLAKHRKDKGRFRVLRIHLTGWRRAVGLGVGEKRRKQLEVQAKGIVVDREEKRRRRGLERMDRVRKKIIFKTKYRCFEGWQDQCQRKKRNRMLVERCRVRMTRRAESQVLEEWVDRTKKARARKARALSMLKRIRAQQAHMTFSTWRQSVEQQKQLKKMIKHTLYQSTIRRFDAWCEHVDRARHCRVVLRRCGQKMRFRTTSKVLAGWRSFVVRRRKLKNIAARVVHRRLYLLFARWTQLIEEAKYVHTVLQRCRQKMERRTEMKAFAGWWSFVVERRKLKNLAARVFYHRLHSLFTRWLEKVEKTQHVQMILQRCHQKIQFRAASKALARWHTFVVERKKLKHLAARVIHRRLYSLFARWIELVDDAKHVQLVLHRCHQRMKFRTTVRAVAGWHRFMVEQRKLRSLATRVFFHRLSSLFMRWSDFTADALDKKQSSAVQSEHMTEIDKLKHEHAKKMNFLAAQMADSDSGAKAAVKELESEYNRSLAMRTITMARNRKITQGFKRIRTSFAAWKYTTMKEMKEKDMFEQVTRQEQEQQRIQVRIQVVLDRCRRKIQRRLSAKAFSQWCSFVLENRGLKQLSARVFRHQLHLLFARWLDTVEETKLRLLASKHLRGRMMHQTMCKAFGRWQNFLVQRKKLKNLAARVIHRRLYLLFARWIELVDDAKHVQLILYRCHQRMKFRTTVRAVAGWHRFMVEQRKLRSLATRVFFHRLSSLFMRWSDFTADALDKKQSSAVQSEHMTEIDKLKHEHAKKMNFLAAQMADSDSGAKAAVKELESEYNRSLAMRTITMARNRKITQGFKRIRTSFAAWKYTTVQDRHAAQQQAQHVHSQKHVQIILERCKQKMTRRRAARALSQWWTFLLERRKLRQFSARVFRRRLHSLFTRWMEVVEDAKHVHLVLRRCRQKIMFRTVMRALGGWRGFVARRRKLRNIAARVVHHRLYLLFARWVESVKDATRIAIILQRCHHRIKFRTSIKALARWHTFVTEKKKLRSLTFRVFRHRLYLLFTRWYDFTENLMKEKEREQQLQEKQKLLKERRQSLDTFQNQLKSAAIEKETELKEMSSGHRRSSAIRTITLARNNSASKQLKRKLRCFCSWRHTTMQSQREHAQIMNDATLARQKELFEQLEVSKQETAESDLQTVNRFNQESNQRTIVSKLAQNRALLQEKYRSVDIRRQVLTGWLRSVREGKNATLQTLQTLQRERVVEMEEERTRHAVELERQYLLQKQSVAQEKELGRENLFKLKKDVESEHSRTLAMRTIKMVRHARINKSNKLIRQCFYEWKVCRVEWMRAKLVESKDRERERERERNERKVAEKETTEEIKKMKSELETTHDQLSKFQESLLRATKHKGKAAKATTSHEKRKHRRGESQLAFGKNFYPTLPRYYF